MSKLNILGIINSIKSKTNVYTPIVEAIVNSIDAIDGSSNGKITIIVKRDKVLPFDGTLAPIISVEIEDNGSGFTQKNRDSFDTYFSDEKISKGGKGFGRFMFLKYFNEVKVESVYKNESDGLFFHRKFNFGKRDEIIINETNENSTEANSFSKIHLNNLLDNKQFDKELETIARKLLEKLLIFFINEKFNCPQIIIQEEDGLKKIVLNSYLQGENEIKSIANKPVTLKSPTSNKTEKFDIKIFKIFFAGNQKSKISLAADNREVIETTLHTYIPEFEDDFYEEFNKGGNIIKKNFIIKAYVLGDYLNESVTVEREAFKFDKDKPDEFYEFSQSHIESEVAKLVAEFFVDDVKVRSEKKKALIRNYVNTQAPWHKTLLSEINYDSIPFILTDEKIEIELQKIKFQKEIEARKEVQELLNAGNDEFENNIQKLVSKLSDVGKNDLAHYVCSRKYILTVFEDLLRRDTDGNAKWEKDIHNLIFPMGKNSEEVQYEDHNLWLLDERLVFSDYIASDKKISKKKGAQTEPDLVIFDKLQCFRNGDNEYSNPITIFEFKKPKREAYSKDEDPINQVGGYLDKIRAGKYELPDGLEKIKANSSTPAYAYIICDLVDKIHEFARQHQLTISPDNEGYFGFHNGYKMYVEMISFKKLLADSTLRNKIFFKKLKLE